MVSHRSLSDKSPQVTWTLLSILADLNNAIVLMVYTCPVISKSFSLLSNPSVSRASLSIGKIVTFMFLKIFNSLARSRYLSFFRVLSIFSCGQPGQKSPQFDKFSLSLSLCFFFLLLLITTRSDHLAEIR